MTWADLFRDLWRADWTSQQIAEAYGTTDERVRTMIAAAFVAEGVE